MGTETYKAAMFWKTLGIATIPVYYKSKQPKIKWLDYADELPSNLLLGRWFAAKYNNIAVITGWQGLCIIDFDDMDVFNNWKAWAEENSKAAQKALRTGRISFSARGAHIYTFCSDAVNLKLPGIDILANHKYALIPPSIHPSGKSYTLFRDALPVRIDSIREMFPSDQIDNALREQTSYTEQAANNNPAPYDPWDSASREAYRPVGMSVVDDIKARYRIQDFFPHAEHSGGNGRWMITQCPFHKDRNPSMSIDIEGQVCKCLAGHGCTPKPLDVIGLYAKLHHLTNEEAISQMRRGL